MRLLRSTNELAIIAKRGERQIVARKPVEGIGQGMWIDGAEFKWSLKEGIA